MMCSSKGAVMLTLELCDDEELVTLWSWCHCGYAVMGWKSGNQQLLCGYPRERKRNRPSGLQSSL